LKTSLSTIKTTIINNRYPIENFVSYKYLSKNFRNIVLSIIVDVEPTSYKKAYKHSCWVHDMQKESVSLETNKTWILT